MLLKSGGNGPIGYQQREFVHGRDRIRGQKVLSTQHTDRQGQTSKSNWRRFFVNAKLRLNETWDQLLPVVNRNALE
ncbi:hypothetical protein DV711_06715 [Motiliproteus coralliicola]|uniref:Uncharacterized protein n=1 Tax=Motiliproteus coralliicola TaxID=2283196 RepID=A0A369WUA5_9GAMM|nr:hypothetical protein DV711_06715 [Motiliproteus coralliicola]